MVELTKAATLLDHMAMGQNSESKSYLQRTSTNPTTKIDENGWCTENPQNGILVLTNHMASFHSASKQSRPGRESQGKGISFLGSMFTCALFSS